MAQGVLVGRAHEIGVVEELVTDLAAGRGGTVWVEGEPGIGKSCLIDTALDRADLRVRVFRGAADELSQSFALRLAADSLGVGVATPDEYRAEIVDLLAGRGGAVNAVSAAAERLLALVDRECARSPVILVGDDLQWADEASLGVWHRLLIATRQQPLLLVCVARPVPRRAALERLRQAVKDPPGAVMIHLEPLTAEQVTALARQVLSAAPGPQLSSLLNHAAGNPLYVREVLDTLIRDGFVRASQGVAELTAPVGELSLSAAIGRRLGFLVSCAASS